MWTARAVSPIRGWRSVRAKCVLMNGLSGSLGSNGTAGWWMSWISFETARLVGGIPPSMMFASRKRSQVFPLFG